MVTATKKAKEKSKRKKTSETRTYQRHKEKTREIHAAESATGRDIAPLSEVVNQKRKDACRHDLLKFIEAYLADLFPLAWCNDHLDAIKKLEGCILHGDRYAFAMPRGSGKTTLCIAASLWAIIYGHRRYLMLIGATDEKAEILVSGVKAAIETNDILNDDFPEVCNPVRRLERIANRAHGQLFNGEPTRLSWKGDEISIATIEGSIASGSVIRAAGLTGSSLRGPIRYLPDGTAIRPDLAILDDPQTDESSISTTQNAYRERLIKGTVLGMAGPKRKIAVVMPCTVIAPGDLAERFLDRERNPQWQGFRTKMLYSMPTNEKWWDKYREVRKSSLQAGNGGKEATELYKAEQSIADAGAAAAWPERFEDGTISAIQTAMNFWIDNPRAFMAEYQNDPMSEDPGNDLVELNADELCKKINQVPRWIVPRDCGRLTAFIDVQQQILFYMVCAWDEHFGGSIIDYGAFPEQNRAYFTSADARPTLAETFPGLQTVAAIYAGLSALSTWLLERRFIQADTGAELKIERLLMDARYETDTVCRVVRQSAHSSLMFPSQGFGITAAKVPVSDWPVKQGERRGKNWVLSAPAAQRGRIVKVDTNLWKSFARERLAAPMGTPGCVSLFGSQQAAHQLLSEHLTAEYRTITTGRGRTLEEWSVRPGRNENHFWDCAVGCCVAASVQGLIWNPGGMPMPVRKRKKIDIEELFARAQ